MKFITTSLLLLISNLLFSQNWLANYQKAEEQARTEQKAMVVVFSGSDWCAPCIKLDRAVWQSESFAKASENWVIYKADFPKKKQNQLPNELKAQNEKLAEKYNPNGIFPLVVMIHADGKILGQLSYESISAEDYIQKIKKILHEN
ncbi:MAG: thioredoxin family protein [Flavobacteriales bacterium]|nr:thioredoxin family protein [Flavobacteriales bacterium]